VLVGTVFITFEYNAQGKIRFSDIIIKLASDVTGKTTFSQISETGVSVISKLAS
jgi:hypothetical protein